MLPQIKKKISSFLVGEQGKISKESMLKLGSFLATTSAAASLLANSAEAAVTHVNSIGVEYSGGTATGTHAHHASGGAGGGGTDAEGSSEGTEGDY